MIPSSWIAHRWTGDGELFGYLVEDDDRPDSYRAVNVFGHPLGEPCGIVEAMDLLEELGLCGLADQWWLHTADGGRTKVKICEATPDQVTVLVDDFDVGADLGTRTVLPVPVGDRLGPTT